MVDYKNKILEKFIKQLESKRAEIDLQFFEEDFEILMKAAEMNSHAFLFDVDENAGHYLAKLFFLFLNCPSTDCNYCRLCESIPKAIHPDFIYMASEKTEILRERIADLIHYAYEKSVEVPRKLLVIEEAHLMNAEASNTLLKVLEEPPPSTVFVLISSRPDALLETIYSRVSKLRLKSRGKLVTKEYIERALRLFVESIVEHRRLRKLDKKIDDFLEEFNKKLKDQAEQEKGELEKYDLEKKISDRTNKLIEQKQKRMKNFYNRELVEQLLSEFLRVLNLVLEKRAGGKSFLSAPESYLELFEMIENRHVETEKLRRIHSIIEEGIDIIYSEVKPAYVLRGVILMSWKVITE